MKKILFIGDAQSIHMKKWLDYFAQNGYETAIATFSENNITLSALTFKLSDKKVDQRGGNYYYLFSVFKLAKIIKQYQPQFINAHYSYSMGFLALLAKKISNSDAQLSVVCHGSDILDFQYNILDFVNKYVLKQAEKIFSVSGQITDQIIKMGIDRNKIFTGQYGIDQDIIYGIEQAVVRDIDIISNRNYVPNSRIDEILEVLDDEYFYNKRIVFVLPYVNPIRMDQLKRKYSFIIFYGMLPHAEIIKLIRRSKIYVSATKSDGSSLSLLEALGSGAFPVVSNIVSNREWILGGLNGELVDDFRSLKNALISVLEQSSEYRGDVRIMNEKIIMHRAIYEKQMEKINGFLSR